MCLHACRTIMRICLCLSVMAGFCTNVEVIINEDNSITVRDNGRGIPVGWHEKEKKSALEVVMTVLHAGGKFDKSSYKVSGGLHGVGVSCVNALSTKCVVTVCREGKIFQQTYAKGKPLTKVEEIGEIENTGTEVSFWPDDTIFMTTEYQFSILENRLRELAYLNKGVRLILSDKRNLDAEGKPKTLTFYSEEGLYHLGQI